MLRIEPSNPGGNMKTSSSPARRFQLDLVEPAPVASKDIFWRGATEIAIIGIFLLLALAALQFSRALLLPITLAMVVGTMMAPLAKEITRLRIPPWLASLMLVAAFLVALCFMIVVLSGLVSEWAAKNSEIGSTLQQKLQVLDRPLAALRDIQSAISGPLGIDLGALKFDVTSNFITPLLSVLTPAIAQLLLFFVTLLFFLAGHDHFRRYLIALSDRRKDRLRILRIFNDVERNLSRYIGTLTLINFAIGALTAALAALIGLPNPIALGVLAFGLNYVPMIGPAIMAIVLLVVGLVVFPSIGYALLAPAIFIAQSVVEGQFVTPNIVGRRMTVNPFVIFLSVAFWVWLWGPLGALLAMPLLIVLLVVRAHVYPKNGIALSK
jgi:predicted PurR-regulated permease PerM